MEIVWLMEMFFLIDFRRLQTLHQPSLSQKPHGLCDAKRDKTIVTAHYSTGHLLTDQCVAYANVLGMYDKIAPGVACLMFSRSCDRSCTVTYARKITGVPIATPACKLCPPHQKLSTCKHTTISHKDDTYVQTPDGRGEKMNLTRQN